MIVLAKSAVRAISSALASEILKQVALLCAAGLLVALLLLTYGIDLTPGLF
jgi:ribose/xylose/arabinose/galactoside ABC-type transport system permease subunit